MASAAVLPGITVAVANPAPHHRQRAETPAVAQPACTISWDGGGGDNLWRNDANWSTDTLPATTDHVCIGSSFTEVVHDSDDDAVLSVQIDGGLTLSGGSLSLTDAANASNAAIFTLSGGGVLGGAGTLTVSGSFGWSGGEQTGVGGRTVIAVGAAATI
ncbi:MAG: hypothetical protein ACRDON_10260, partial [Gaiellaceae bacterium]